MLDNIFIRQSSLPQWSGNPEIVSVKAGSYQRIGFLFPIMSRTSFTENLGFGACPVLDTGVKPENENKE